MGLVRKIAQVVKASDKIKVLMQGKVISGTVLDIDTISVTDSTLILEDEKGKRWIVPINNNIAIQFIPNEEDVSESEDDKELGYDDMNPLQLKNLCDERGIDYRNSVKKKGLINLLTYDDEQKSKKKKKK